MIFHSNWPNPVEIRSRVSSLGGRNLLWLLAFTATCTTVQAVISDRTDRKTNWQIVRQTDAQTCCSKYFAALPTTSAICIPWRQRRCIRQWSTCHYVTRFHCTIVSSLRYPVIANTKRLDHARHPAAAASEGIPAIVIHYSGHTQTDTAEHGIYRAMYSICVHCSTPNFTPTNAGVGLKILPNFEIQTPRWDIRMRLYEIFSARG